MNQNARWNSKKISYHWNGNKWCFIAYFHFNGLNLFLSLSVITGETKSLFMLFMIDRWPYGGSLNKELSTAADDTAVANVWQVFIIIPRRRLQWRQTFTLVRWHGTGVVRSSTESVVYFTSLWYLQTLQTQVLLNVHNIECVTTCCWTGSCSCLAP